MRHAIINSNNTTMKLKVLLFTMLVSFSAWAQQRGIVVQGTLTSANPNVSVANIPVNISDSTGNLGLLPTTTYTNSNGFYRDTVLINGSQGALNIWITNCIGQSVHQLGSLVPASNIIVANFNYCGAQTGCQAGYTWNAGPAGMIYFTNTSSTVLGPPPVYYWTFGDGTTSNSASPAHVYTSNGQYAVSLTMMAGGCTSTFWDSVVVQNASSSTLRNVYGFVIGPPSIPGSVANQVEVILYDQNWNGVDTTMAMPDSTGFFFYFFPNKPQGTYKALAQLTGASTTANVYLPTYYQTATAWQQANDLIVGGSMGATSYDITLQQIVALPAGGSGSVSGNIIRGNLRSTSGMLPKAKVYLLNAAGTAVHAWKYSDANGAYTFNGLPAGTYRIHVEWSGKNQPAFTVNLANNTSQVTGVNFVVNNNGITTGIVEQPLNVEAAFPNPVKEALNLNLKVASPALYQFEWRDLSGRLIQSEARQLREGQQSLSIETRSLIPGLYLFQIRENDRAIHTMKVAH